MARCMCSSVVRPASAGCHVDADRTRNARLIRQNPKSGLQWSAKAFIRAFQEQEPVAVGQNARGYQAPLSAGYGLQAWVCKLIDSRGTSPHRSHACRTLYARWLVSAVGYAELGIANTAGPRTDSVRAGAVNKVDKTEFIPLGRRLSSRATVLRYRFRGATETRVTRDVHGRWVPVSGAQPCRELMLYTKFLYIYDGYKYIYSLDLNAVQHREGHSFPFCIGSISLK